jgi:hypothetical protein
MRRLHPVPRVLALVAALAAAACSDSTAAVTPAEAAGVYTLASVTGRGPSSGTFTLTADGGAQRQAHFESRFSPYDQQFVGSFTIDGGTITFELIPRDLPADFVWPVKGQWLGSYFTITYPDPADGPNIVELYRRQ